MITPEAPAFLTGRGLPRRTILRGIGAAIGLPFLEAMSPAMAAGAQGKAPVRMAFFYVPNGIIMDAWNPDYEGPFRELPRALKSLEPYKQDMLQIGNLTHNTGRALLDGAGDHGRCCGSYLTGVHVKKSVVEIKSSVSFDQLVAAEIGKQTRFPSLELGMDDAYVENRNLFPTEAATPQGGIISPTLANMTLDGLEKLLLKHFPRQKWKDGKKWTPKVNLVRYADNFIITGDSRELLENEVVRISHEIN